ncbi:MAG: hypothetical protein ACTHKG_11945, partial [Nocardioides sp.]
SLARALSAGPELWVAGLAFAAYPALRPFSDEVSRAGALAFASPRWIIAHTFGIAAFTLLALGLFRLTEAVTSNRSRARTGLALAWIGTGLTLPYYGAEVFGLHAAGQQALAGGSISQFDDLTRNIRWEAGIYFILLGLLVLAIGVIVLATAVWRDMSRPAQTVLPLAVAVALYIPQFAATQPVRVAHGVLMAAGCILLSVGLTDLRHPRA